MWIECVSSYSYDNPDKIGWINLEYARSVSVTELKSLEPKIDKKQGQKTKPPFVLLIKMNRGGKFRSKRVFGDKRDVEAHLAVLMGQMNQSKYYKKD